MACKTMANLLAGLQHSETPMRKFFGYFCFIHKILPFLNFPTYNTSISCKLDYKLHLRNVHQFYRLSVLGCITRLVYFVHIFRNLTFPC